MKSEKSPLLASESNSNHEIEDIKPYCTTDLALRFAVNTIVASGTGLAMMPVFNHLVKNSEKFGINVHANDTIFDISTINTFAVSLFSSFITMNEFIKKHQEGKSKSDSPIIILSKISSSFSLTLPLGALWITELHNQKVANSSGFDEYMAWAAFTTIPLATNQIISSIVNVNKSLAVQEQNKDGILSVGGQIITYGLSLASLVGRSITYTEICKSLALATGMSDEVALTVGIVTGGILATSGISILEHNVIKNLFEIPSGKFTVKKLAIGSFAFTQGVWFTLPLVSIGLDATNDWNPLLKGAVTIPLLASHTILESTRIYDNISTFCDYVSDGFSTLKDWCYGNDQVQITGDNSDFFSE